MFRTQAAALVGIAMAIYVLMPASAGAAGLTTVVPCTGASGANPCTVCSLADLAQNLLNDAVYIAVFLAAFLMAYAGIQMLISPTNPSNREKARSLFTDVVVGFIIILSAWLIVNAIMSLLFAGSLAWPWYKIC